MNGIRMTDYEPDIRPVRDASGKITAGLVVGDILRQNQALILLLHPGELKENPAVGCGIADMLLDHDPLRWRAVVREQLEMDGQRIDRIRITRTGIELDAAY